MGGAPPVRGARRLVSLSPSTTENVFALGAGRWLVGATTACDWPAEARRVARIGDFRQPAWERIAALRPDAAVVESATLPDDEARAVERRLGCPLVVLRTRSLADLDRTMETLGIVCGADRAARRLRDGIARRRASVAAKVAGRRRPSVFVEVSPSPLYAAGKGSFVDDLVAAGGGRNVVDIAEPFPVVSKERLLAWNPEVYVVAAAADAPASRFAPPLDTLAAVRGGRVLRIDPDHLFRPTPRLLDGLESLARALHPGAFANGKELGDGSSRRR